MCRKGKFNFIYKVLIVIVATGGLLLLPSTSFAQDLPCGDQSPFGPCPLDTDVWILVFIAAIFGAVNLHRKQKQQRYVRTKQ